MHSHHWRVTDDTKITAAARYLVGETSRVDLHRSCECGALLCGGKVPTRRGSEYGCALTLGHPGSCQNELIPQSQRY